MNIVNFTPSYYPELTRGRPISLGKIYVGIPDTDPTIEANQRTLSVRQEDGTIVEVSQPIRTNAAGVPVYDGSPVTLLVTGDYSLKVLNYSDVQQYYIPYNLPQSSVYCPDPDATDQGVTGDYNTIKYYVDLLDGDTGTIFLKSGAYTLSTSETIPSNVTFKAEPGAVIDGAGTLTINGDFICGSTKVFDSSLTVAFGSNSPIDSVKAEWRGAGPDSTATINHAALELALTDANGLPVTLNKIGTWEFNSPVSYAGEVHIKGRSNIRSNEQLIVWEMTADVDAIDHTMINGRFECEGINFFYDAATYTANFIDIDVDGLTIAAGKLQNKELLNIHHNSFTFSDGPAAASNAINIYTDDANAYLYWTHINNNFFMYQYAGINIDGDVATTDPLGSINGSFINENTFVFSRIGIKLRSKAAGNVIANNIWQPHSAANHIGFVDTDTSGNIFGNNKIFDMSDSRYGYRFRDNLGTSGYAADNNIITGGSGVPAIEIDDATTTKTNQHYSLVTDADHTFFSYPQATIYGVQVNNGLYVPSNYILGKAEIAKTANFNIAQEDSGNIYTNEGASGNIIGSLPDISEATIGMQFTFVWKAAHSFRVDPNGTDTIGYGAAGDAMIIDTSSSKLSNSVLTLKAVSTTHWDIISTSGGWGFDGARLATTATWNPGNLVAGDTGTTQISLTGAEVGDFVLVSFSLDVQDMSLTANVNTANFIDVVLSNNTPGALNLAEGTVYIKLIKR